MLTKWRERVTDMGQADSSNSLLLDPRQCIAPLSQRHWRYLPALVPIMTSCSSPFGANPAQWSDGDDGPSPGNENILRLDLRYLPAPEPMHRILEALESLPEGRSLLARTPCRPQPLLDLLDARGYRVFVTVAQAGDAWVHIFSSDDCTGR